MFCCYSRVTFVTKPTKLLLAICSFNLGVLLLPYKNISVVDYRQICFYEHVLWSLLPINMPTLSIISVFLCSQITAFLYVFSMGKLLRSYHRISTFKISFLLEKIQ